ncbi:DUF4309 domain-containing protein [Jeotgalibacillus sp. R-1-5s-1]|uniref:DUF4309 domain-containing protein n=1 Tax=Jeotgalibacillus sp. R-1-5s-1 TaxID=2555897 RepID=UPI00141BEBA3|nr:DUF4309 domain-containing protein [Jeotgalibacillus sp. R-1-5s-1]
MKKLVGMLMALLVFFSISSTTEAADSRLFVKWDDSTLVDGQIGRVTLVKDAVLFKMENGSLKKTNLLRTAGNKYRIYGFSGSGNYQYLAVGGGYYLHNTTATTYETPSSAKKRQLELVIDDSIISSGLRTLIEKGKLPRTPLDVNTSTMYDMREMFGKPVSQGYNPFGSYGFDYGKFNYSTNYFRNGESGDLVSIQYEFHPDYVITPAQIKQRIGTTGLYNDGISEKDGIYHLNYQIGNYQLWFHYDDKEGKSLRFIAVVDKRTR